MKFEDFCEFVQVIVLDEMAHMYKDSESEELPVVEEVLRERLNLKSAFRERRRRGYKNRDYVEELSAGEQKLYDKLRKVRMEIAQEMQIPAYQVFTNRTLAQMCRELPLSKEEMKTLYGVGNVNSEKYGQRFLDAIHSFTDEEEN